MNWKTDGTIQVKQKKHNGVKMTHKTWMSPAEKNPDVISKFTLTSILCDVLHQHWMWFLQKRKLVENGCQIWI